MKKISVLLALLFISPAYAQYIPGGGGGSGGGGSGNVTGPGSSTDGDVAEFSGTTGKVLQDPGFAPAPVGQDYVVSSSPATITTGQWNANVGFTPTAAITITLAASSGYASSGGGVYVNPNGQVVTIALASGTDTITQNGAAGSAGASLVLPATAVASWIKTDAAGKFYVSPSGGVTGLSIASGKTLTVSNTLTLAGTDSSTLNIGTGGTLGTAAFQNTGTSGATLGFLNGNNTESGNLTFSAVGGVSTSALLMSATWNTAGSATTNFSQLFIKCSGSTNPTTWVTGGSGLAIQDCNNGTQAAITVYNATGVQVFQADAFGNLNAAATVYSGANNGFQFGASSSHGNISAGTDGNIAIDGSSNHSSSFQFNGTSSSFPELLRNGTEIDFKLADNSAFTTAGALVYSIAKTTTPAAPGAGRCSIVAVQGTTTTGTIEALCGTSATPTAIVSNIGSGF